MAMERRIKDLLVEATRDPHPDKLAQAHIIRNLTHWFQQELTKKAAEKAIQEMRDNYSRSAEDASTRPADDPRPSIRVGDILEK